MIQSKINTRETNAFREVCDNFSRNIGTKTEPLLWGVKATPEVIAAGCSALDELRGHKKVSAVKVIETPLTNLEQAQTMAKGLQKDTVIYIPHAEAWDQDFLLKTMAAFGERRCKCFLGFSDFAGLSMGIHTFLVSYQIDSELRISRWAINMSVPIRELSQQQ